MDSRTLEATLKSLQDETVARRHAFSPAEEHVFTLMSKDSYPRFIRSQIYKGVLSAAQQQVSISFTVDRFACDIQFIFVTHRNFKITESIIIMRLYIVDEEFISFVAYQPVWM